MVTWNGLITLVATGATLLVTYVFQAVMARLLTTLEYGELSAIVATLNVLTIPVFGLCMAITRDVAAVSGGNQRQLAAIVRRYALRVGGVTALIIAGLVLFSSWLSGFLQLATLTPLIYLMVLVTLTNVVGAGRAMLLGLHDFASAALNQVAEALLRLVSATGVALYGLVAIGGFAGYALGLLGAMVLLAARASKSVGHRAAAIGSDREHAIPTVSGGHTELGDISFAAIVVSGTFIVLLNMDLIVVKHFLTPDIAGQYAAISMLAKTMFVITNAFDVVLFPMATSARAFGGDESAHLRGALLSIGLIVLPVLAVYRLVPTALLGVLFGPRFTDVAPLLFPYALGVTLLGFATLIARYRLAVGRRTPSVTLLAVPVGAAAAYLGFHETPTEIVNVLLVTGSASLVLGVYGLIGVAPEPRHPQ